MLFSFLLECIMLFEMLNLFFSYNYYVLEVVKVNFYF